MNQNARMQRSRGSFRPRADRIYIAFNKPYAVLSQFTPADETGKRTLAEFDFPADVYPVGRLDYDSEGLLLLSDDARLNAALLDPVGRHPRTYLAQVENLPTPAALTALCNGVMVQGRMTLPAVARQIEQDPELPTRPVPIRFRKNVPTSWIELTLTEGRNRQVRRMTAVVGLPTLRLMRTAIGSLRLFELNLSPGQWRVLSEEEILLAFR